MQGPKVRINIFVNWILKIEVNFCRISCTFIVMFIYASNLQDNVERSEIKETSKGITPTCFRRWQDITV